MRHAIRPMQRRCLLTLATIAASLLHAAAQDNSGLTAALPEGPGSVAQDSDLFRPFPTIPGEPADPVTPELRQLIEESLADPLLREAPLPPPPKPSADPKLVALATHAAGRVVGLRAWDGFGEELARGCGSFISTEGDVLADISLVRASHARRIEYITVLTGHGARHRVTGYRWADATRGLVILKTDAVETPALTLNATAAFTKPLAVRILALHEVRGVILADATARADASQTGAGWLNLRGKDSPGEPGSPVLNDRGEAIGIVAMRVPEKDWVNFGVTAAAVAAEVKAGLKLPVHPLAKLESSLTNRVVQDERFITAFQELYAGRIASAARQLLPLRTTYPRSAEVWALLGLACAKAGARDEAANCNRKAVALDPEVGQYWYQLGIGHLSQSQPPERSAAVEALAQAVEDRPTDLPAWLMLAERQVVEGRYREAERSLLQVIKLRPGYTHALYLLGYTRGKLGDYPAAESAMKQCLTLERKNSRAWFYLGLLYTKQRRYPEAIAALRETVATAPEHPHAWQNLAVLQRRTGRITEAVLAHRQHQRVLAGQR
jgi:tetratricopeptide (TPR) repeat protein